VARDPYEPPAPVDSGDIVTHRAASRRVTTSAVIVGVLTLVVVAAAALAFSRGVGFRTESVQNHSGDAARSDKASPPATPSATASPSVTASPSGTPGNGTSPAPVAPAPVPTAGRPTSAGGSGSTSTPSSPGGTTTLKAFVTGYSYFDNTPPGSLAISHSVLHPSAGGTGTYDDPITVAVGHSLSAGVQTLDWAKGTRFYIPNLRRYFIVEDTCGDGSSPQNGPCHTGYPAPATTWLDIWIGGMGGSASGADACMDAVTGTWDVLVNPPSNYAVVAGSVYGAGGCTQQYGNAFLGG
jgi:hypothetical protein